MLCCRASDDLPSVAKLCRRKDIPHLVNNAYGLQSTKCAHLLEEVGKEKGQHDVFVQSADKNLMVPVGGAIIAGFDRKWVQTIAKTYPGRHYKAR
jgi:O-phospho-L-seryl-tRNASec:L-selenocysteinyl-tRNA synthase